MKRMLSLVLALIMVLSMASMLAQAEDANKPAKISIMVDGTLVTEPNGRAEFEARWEELTGIDLEIIQPDHSSYYEVLSQRVATGNLPDAFLLGSEYYSSYAAAGLLWEMTDAWENSATHNSGRFFGDYAIEGLKMDGKLYGIPMAKGNGCVTYIKKAWLDAVNLDAPTTYEEYLNVLVAFTPEDPDGNGESDTFGVTAAGFIGPEAPWVNYFPEFYQDATPSFYKDEDGVWHDGFVEPEMQAALERMTEAYALGTIDPETLTNTTANCREKFYDDKFGVFTYWAGQWASNLKNNLEIHGKDGELVALEPIEEVGAYIDRVSGCWCISAACENPEGVYDWFIDNMLDGGDVQFLWTYGVEGVHWSRKAETLYAGTSKEVTYTEGQFHFLDNRETPGSQYKKSMLDPALVFATYKEGFEAPTDVAPENAYSANLFNTHSKSAQLVPGTEAKNEYDGDLLALKKELVANIIMGKISYEEAMEQFEAEGGNVMSQAIVDSLNAIG